MMSIATSSARLLRRCIRRTHSALHARALLLSKCDARIASISKNGRRSVLDVRAIASTASSATARQSIDEASSTSSITNAGRTNAFATWLVEQSSHTQTDVSSKSSSDEAEVLVQVRRFLGMTDPLKPSVQITATQRRTLVASSAFVHKLGAVIEWCFATYGDALPPPASSEPTTDQTWKQTQRDEVQRVMSELMAWGNMARSTVWQHFYMRHFFLSLAPLDAFLDLHETHRVAQEEQGPWVLPLSAPQLMREYCWRGRFEEAVTVFTRLELSDEHKRSFTALLHQYEQYEVLRRVYSMQEQRETELAKSKDMKSDQDLREKKVMPRANSIKAKKANSLGLLAHHRKGPAPLLDPVFILHALKALGLRDELAERFQQLPAHERRRQEIQKLCKNL